MKLFFEQLNISIFLYILPPSLIRSNPIHDESIAGDVRGTDRATLETAPAFPTLVGSAELARQVR